MTLTLPALFTLMAMLVICIAVCTLIYRQIAALGQHPPMPPDWQPELSVETYRPMFRLLSQEDIRFLRSHPGATPGLVQRLRKRRCQVFRGYLQSMESDFRAVLQALTLVMVQSQSDRRDIVRTLVVSRLRFALGVYRIRFRLLVYRWNVGQEPVAHIMGLFEGLRLELLALTETPTATPQLS